ncbi:MAG: hypothetical protein ABIG39_06915 [Candidatus Micrarchaeota archaeon]
MTNKFAQTGKPDLQKQGTGDRTMKKGMGEIVISDKLTLGEIYRKMGKSIPDSLKGVTVKEMNDKLKVAERDESAGISHALVKRDEQSEIGLHVAAVEEGVNAHVHMVGNEDYIFLEGNGVMKLGKVKVDGDKPVLVDGKAVVEEWEEHEVRPGMVLTVPGGYAHRLVNNNESDNPVKIAFTCPDSHLDDNRDRRIVENPN